MPVWHFDMTQHLTLPLQRWWNLNRRGIPLPDYPDLAREAVGPRFAVLLGPAMVQNEQLGYWVGVLPDTNSHHISPYNIGTLSEKSLFILNEVGPCSGIDRDLWLCLCEPDCVSKWLGSRSRHFVLAILCFKALKNNQKPNFTMSTLSTRMHFEMRRSCI